MDELYLENVKKVAYFLWEHTGYDDALKHWYCAEDIACYLEEYSIDSVDAIGLIIKKGRYDYGYIQFVRHIAFRIYVYTNNEDHLSNWFNAEKFISNYEWCEAVTWVANYYGEKKTKSGFINGLRSDKVRNYYNPNNFFI